MTDADNNSTLPSNRLDNDARLLALALLDRGEPIPAELLGKLLPRDHNDPVLVYPGKRSREEVLAQTPSGTLLPLFHCGEIPDAAWQNMLIRGDNLPVLKTLLEIRQQGELKNEDGLDGVRLIYIDPPFTTGKTFRSRGGRKAYDDTLSGVEFIEFLRQRLVLAHELLSEDGTIYIHLDQRMVSSIRIVMDEIFGPAHFLNEIAWIYRGREASRKHWNQKHDTILVYAKCRGKHIFNWTAVVEMYSPVTLSKFKFKDEKGQFQVRGKATAGSPVRQADGLTLEDEIRYPGLTYRQYLGDGVLPRDWWDIQPVNKSAREKTGYPTQKPEALLARVIAASSNPGDIVLDYFAGSGTTLAVAEKLGRRWIGIDQSELASDVIKARLIDLREKIGNQGKRISPRSFIVYSLE